MGVSAVQRSSQLRRGKAFRVRVTALKIELSRSFLVDVGGGRGQVREYFSLKFGGGEKIGTADEGVFKAEDSRQKREGSGAFLVREKILTPGR